MRVLKPLLFAVALTIGAAMVADAQFVRINGFPYFSVNLLFSPDNTYDIGATNANRPRDIRVGRNVIVAGNVEVGDAKTFYWGSRSQVASPADGVITLLNSAATDFTRLQFACATSSCPSLKRSGTELQAQLADGTDYSDLTGKGLNYKGSIKNGNSNALLLSVTAPTISSGFGTSPSIVANNGTAAFTVNVGTGGAATSGVIGLPTATTGWNCFASDRTTAIVTRQTATTTATATLTAASAWTASDILQVSCFAY